MGNKNSCFLQKIIILGVVFAIGGWTAGCRSSSTGQFDPSRLKIDVSRDGMILLSLAEMQAAGLDIEQLQPARLRLSHNGTAVPYTLHHNHLIFYGQSPTDRYTPTRTYVLETGKPGLLMRETAVPPNPSSPTLPTIQQTTHLEKNLIYESRARTPTHQSVWFWHQIQPGDTVQIEVMLPDITGGSGQLTLKLWGLNNNPQMDPDHDADVYLNGRFLSTIRWDGAAVHQPILTIPEGLLQTGHNRLELRNPTTATNPIDVMLLDWLEISYTASPILTGHAFTTPTAGNGGLTGLTERPFLFNLHHPAQPELLTKWSYQAETAVLAIDPTMTVLAVPAGDFQEPDNLSLMRRPSWPENGAGVELVIITTDALVTAVTPLKQHREAAGLTVAVIPIAEIYDNFGFGQTTPAAIRTFLKHATTDWSPPPRYVLLVGDAITDYQSFVHPLPPQYVPSLMVPVTYGGETISDARLGDVDDDGRPDLAIGRWPVHSRQQVAGLVRRTLAYEQRDQMTAGSLLIDPTDPTFVRMAGRLWADGRSPHLEAINPQQGSTAPNWQSENRWLAVYIGHGSLSQWGQTSLLQQDKLPSSMPPIILQFTCLTGLFAHPTRPSLSETMLLASNGPALIVAATSLTLSQHQEPFAAALLAEVGNTAVLRIGDAFLHAQQALDTQSHPEYQEIRDTFVLLGDPATHIMRPAP